MASVLKNPPYSLWSSGISSGCFWLHRPSPWAQTSASPLLVTADCSWRLRSVQSACNSLLIYISPALWRLCGLSGSADLNPSSSDPSLQMESASDRLPSPFCLPCAPIGLHRESASAAQITASHWPITHTRTQTLTVIHTLTHLIQGDLFFKSILKLIFSLFVTVIINHFIVISLHTHTHTKITVDSIWNWKNLDLSCMIRKTCHCC